MNWAHAAPANVKITDAKTGHGKRLRMLSARVTHMEMHAPTRIVVPRPEEAEAVVIQLKECPLHFYRYIYDRIGRRHHWSHRRKMTDADLLALIHAPETVLHVLYLDGCPAGLCEINLRRWPVVELLYFGLMEEFQGRGWGRFFLGSMIDYGWSHQPAGLMIQTNTLDSPHALTLYQKMGFMTVMERDVMLEAWPDD